MPFRKIDVGDCVGDSVGRMQFRVWMSATARS